MPAVEDILTVNEQAVRKWGTMLFAIADYDTAAPGAFFGGDTLPIALPADHLDLGFVTTDGITVADSISSESTSMLQSLEPVRDDLTGRDQSLSVVFGEANAWVNALYHAAQVADFPADRDGEWEFTDAGITDTPYYRILLYGQDGVGSQAVYRVEYAYRAKVTSKTDRALGRSASESFGFTFKLFRDSTLDKTLYRGQNGPGLGSATSEPTVTGATPSGGAPGDLLKITGSRFLGTTGITIDGQAVVEFQVDDFSTIYAIIPSGVTGAADIVVTTPAGASDAYSYTAA